MNARAGMCCLCDRWARPAVIVGEVLGSSGPGWVQYAHPSCAQKHGRKPIDAEQETSDERGRPQNPPMTAPLHVDSEVHDKSNPGDR